MARDRHVDVILVRDERPERVEHVDLSRDGSAGIGITLVVGPEWTFVRMGACILVGNTCDDSVGEHLRAVAGGDVAPIESFTDEEGVVVGAVVVRLVELVESTVVARERERRAAHARLA